MRPTLLSLLPPNYVTFNYLSNMPHNDTTYIFYTCAYIQPPIHHGFHWIGLCLFACT